MEQLDHLDSQDITEQQRSDLINEVVSPHLRETLGDSVSHNHVRDGYKGLTFDPTSPDVIEYFEAVPPEAKFQTNFDLAAEVEMLTKAKYLSKKDVHQTFPARADVRIDTNGEPRFTVRFEGLKYNPIEEPLFETDKGPADGTIFSVIQLTKTHSAVPLHPNYRAQTGFNVYYRDSGKVDTYECQVLPERLPQTDLHLQHFFWTYFEQERIQFVKLSRDFRILVHSNTVDQHIAHLKSVFFKLDELQYPFTFSQSSFFVPSVEW